MSSLSSLAYFPLKLFVFVHWSYLSHFYLTQNEAKKEKIAKMLISTGECSAKHPFAGQRIQILCFL